jgi:hypothetical protein
MRAYQAGIQSVTKTNLASAHGGASNSALFNRRVALFGVFGVCLTFAVTLLAQQAPPVLNEPYRCANGHTFTILKCVPYRADQWCTWREIDQNGVEVVTANSAWTQMAGRMAGCTVTSAAKPATPTPTSPASGSSVPSGNTPASAPSGPLNPAYLKSFPTSAQLTAQLKGSSAEDTTNLQLGALRELPQIIQDLAGKRAYQNQFTADEKRLLGDYSVAYYKMAAPLNYPLDGYFGRPELSKKLADTFGMDPVFQQWFAINKHAAAYNAKTSPSGTGGPGNGGGSGSGTAGSVATPIAPTNDPGKAAIARCLELGGGALECLGGGISKELLGPLDDTISAPANTGLRMLGSYSAPSNKISIAFVTDSATITGCGVLVPLSAGYQVQKLGSQFAIKLQTSPQPVLVGVGADGKLVAPSAVTLDGQIIVGYKKETTWKTDRATGQTVPGSVQVVDIPVYGPKTDHCALGSMNPNGAVADDGFLASLSGVIDAIGAVAGDADSAKAVEDKTLASGPRIIGTYVAPGGLRVQFISSKVVIDCQRAHVGVPYQVSAAAAGVTITAKDASAPLTLLMQSETSLVGTGNVTVKGRLLAGFDASNNPAFTPISATCALGTFALSK